MEWSSDYYLYDRISKFLQENNITDYFDPFAYCQNMGWNLIPYTSDGFQDERFVELYKISEDGFSIYENNEYSIFYNPLRYEPRINFTISHEIGHIELFHHFVLPQKILMISKNKNTIWEKQADTFAGNILMPAKEFKNLRDLNRRPYVEGSRYGVSNQALQVRWNTLDYDVRQFNKIKPNEVIL